MVTRKRSFSSLPLLGKGGFGTVKFTRVEGKQLALKVVTKPQPFNSTSTTMRNLLSDNETNNVHEIQQSKVDCSRQEATLLSLLSHENIIRLVKLEEDDYELRLYEEFVPGLSLQETLERRTDGRLREEEARSFFKQLVFAMTHAHSRSVCHFDLKPENVVLHPLLGAKIIDFGLGALLKDESTPLLCGCSGGTLSYTAPEVLKEDKCSKPADVWSLGVLLYRMVLGRTPFTGSTQWEIRDNIIDPTLEAYVPLDLTRECQSLLTQLLNKNPEQRPTMEQVLIHPWLQVPLQHTKIISSTSACSQFEQISRPRHLLSAAALSLFSSCPGRLTSIMEEEEEEQEQEEAEEAINAFSDSDTDNRTPFLADDL